MKASELVVGNWYHIEYENKRNSEWSFAGSAKLMAYNECAKAYEFYSPMSGHENGLVRMLFKLKDIKHVTTPLPTYNELYTMYTNIICAS